ncbi:hypothetical protein B7P43_G05628 [Cryptotermes secundus]|nr:hypothetical protein B7P43_G05628 [Cryptotermes secundus]PNF39720.1 hypothetical protein B7P43_G05628 [Cryptotermes secundus]PNF39722.1 hypothetical protein B7P43_G05628 [Cryptotermes secundus]
MQSHVEVHESVQETAEGAASQKEGSAEPLIKKGPENCSSHEEDPKDEILVKIENGNLDAGDTNSDCNDTDCMSGDKAVIAEEDAEKTLPKSKSVAIKEKKLKKSASPKISPKGKQSPKSKKEAKPDIKEEDEAANKEKEKLQNKKLESELRSHESAPIPDLQPSVQITQLISPLTEAPEMNDSVVEVPHQDQNKSHVSSPSASVEESSLKPLDTHSTKGSPRRSSRLATHLSLPKQRSPAKPDSSSIIVLESDDNISVLEISQKFQEKSFAQTLRSLSGRPSLRPLPAYNRSFSRPSTVGSASIRSNFSSRSWTTTGNDSESEIQDTKLLQPRAGLWGLFRTSSQNTSSQDCTTDNEESTNRSLADDSGNDSEATNDPLEVPSSLSFGKRKCQDAGFLEEAEQEHKRIKGDGRKNSANISAGLLSIVSSPMNLFASKIKGEKGKSSTPVQMLKAFDLDEGTRDDTAIHQDDVSEIQYEDENPNYVGEKESLGAVLQKMDEAQEVAPRRWCSIM